MGWGRIVPRTSHRKNILGKKEVRDSSAEKFFQLCKKEGEGTNPLAREVTIEKVINRKRKPS